MKMILKKTNKLHVEKGCSVGCCHLRHHGFLIGPLGGCSSFHGQPQSIFQTKQGYMEVSVVMGVSKMIKMVGLCHGKSHLEMDDDWGQPYDETETPILGLDGRSVRSDLLFKWWKSPISWKQIIISRPWLQHLHSAPGRKIGRRLSRSAPGGPRGISPSSRGSQPTWGHYGITIEKKHEPKSGMGMGMGMVMCHEKWEKMEKFSTGSTEPQIAPKKSPKSWDLRGILSNLAIFSCSSLSQMIWKYIAIPKKRR